MSEPVLLFSDLDRTILPNGLAEESPEARPRLHALAAHPQVTLIYVTGRHLALLEQALEEYAVPVPDIAIGDVGTSVYFRRGRSWSAWDAWRRHLSEDWEGRTPVELARLLRNVPELRLQEPEKQNDFKLSYYAPPEAGARGITEELQRRLRQEGVRANVIWSVDEVERRGLVDVLPARATKLHAIRFLLAERGFPEHRTVVAGDSGNDLDALTSGLQAVLVRNAAEDVRTEAIHLAREAGVEERLYLPRGGFLGMNGNYAAGVLEGVAFFIPETAEWMEVG